MILFAFVSGVFVGILITVLVCFIGYGLVVINFNRWWKE